MARCEKCGNDHDDPRVNRKIAERSFTLFSVLAMLDAAESTKDAKIADERSTRALISIAAFVGLNVSALTKNVATLGRAKIEELMAANKDPREWAREQLNDAHQITIVEVAKTVSPRDDLN